MYHSTMGHLCLTLTGVGANHLVCSIYTSFSLVKECDQLWVEVRMRASQTQNIFRTNLMGLFDIYSRNLNLPLSGTSCS